jgi:hypothetical protein
MMMIKILEHAELGNHMVKAAAQVDPSVMGTRNASIVDST